MANTQSLKRRIRSVGNTRQITKAMELVSAAKMRRVVEAAHRSRVYSDAAISILRRLSSSVEAKHHPYFSPPKNQARLYIVVTSDSGLAGAYNSNVLNLCYKEFANVKAQGAKPQVIALGRKGAHHFSRIQDVELVGDYEKIEDNPDINVFAPILESITLGMKNGDWGAVELIYTEFISTVSQKATKLTLIPIETPADVADVEQKPDGTVFEFEPSAEAVLDSAVKLYLESTLRRARIEAAASEHAMRMMSMNNANRNAGDLIDGLTLELNATRQAAITQEMAEIIGGASAVV